MSYDQLDTIADTYIPVLVIVSTVLVVREALHRGVGKARGDFIVLLSCIVFTYAVMLLDQWLSLWPILGLDYSTHTAVAWVFIVFLFHGAQTVKKINLLQSLVVLSMGLYVGLMLYQQYHTVIDIISTSLVVLPIFVFFHSIKQKLN